MERQGTACSLLLTLLVGACSNAPAVEVDAPAVLLDPSEDTLKVVSAAVSEMLGAPVTLSKDSLVSDSWITVERMRPRDASGQQMQGRVMERPEQFQLVKRNEQCVLVQQSSGKRKILESKCRLVGTL